MKRSAKIAVVLIVIVVLAAGYSVVASGAIVTPPPWLPPPPWSGPTPTPIPFPSLPPGVTPSPHPSVTPQPGVQETFTKLTSGMYFVLTFADGSSQKIDSSGNVFNGPYSITSGGAQVTSAQIIYYVTPTFTGTIATYTMVGTMDLTYKIVDASTGAVMYQTSQALNQLYTPTLSNNHAASITSASVPAATLEGLASFVGGHTYKLVLTGATIPMSIVFADGKTVQQTATPPQATWTFGVTQEQSFQSLSINFAVSSQ